MIKTAESIANTKGFAIEPTQKYYKTKDSTTRNFSIQKVIGKDFFSNIHFSCGDNLELNIILTMHDITDGFDKRLIPISEFEYQSFLEVYDLHVKVMLSKGSDDETGKEVGITTGKSSPSYLLSNPLWRANMLSRQRKAMA